MKTTKLYFATNRAHEGANQWKPTGYGKKFSSDGHENLRFGELSLSYNPEKVEDCLTKKFKKGRVGDGEKLSAVLMPSAKKANITAYEDYTATTDKPIAFANNSSTVFFRNIKGNMMQGADVLIFIHGYNVSWDSAVASAAALQLSLNAQRKKGEKEIIVVLFSWPSNGSMMPFAAYKSDRVDARNSGASIGRGILKLRDFLATLKRDALKDNEKLCGSNIHLLCHSMGNYVMRNAIEKKLIGYSRGRMPRIFQHVFLCAADVNDDALENPNNGFSRLHELAANVSVYHNQEDFALHISDATKNEADRLGQSGSAHPALVHNKVHQVDCTPIVRGFTEHSYYLWATVNYDIRQSIQGIPFNDKRRERKLNGQNREWTMT